MTYTSTNIHQILTHICKKYLFENMSEKGKTPAANLKRRKRRLWVPIHMKIILIFMNIDDYTLLVLNRALYTAIYCLGYCPFVGPNLLTALWYIHTVLRTKYERGFVDFLRCIWVKTSILLLVAMHPKKGQ